ncbi:Uncharacterised protein [uncultured archaeon]|nr:Uncharacterised protein [uncultured archaeon]
MQVSFWVHESEAHRWDAKVAALLKKVACQKSETSGIKWKGMVEAVFRREVGYGVLSGIGYFGIEPALVGIHLGIESGHDGVVAPQKAMVTRCSIQHRFLHQIEQSHRILGLELRAASSQQIKEAFGLRVPAPPEIACQFTEADNPLRQIRKFAFVKIHQFSPSGVDREYAI